MARCIVTSSAYSRSLPTGTPIAMRVTLDAERLEQLGEVDRGRFPFDVGIGREDRLPRRAPSPTRASSPLIFRSSGPTPCSGDSAPISTW